MPRPRRPIGAAVVLCGLILLIILTRQYWLTAIGEALVGAEAPEKADALLVLAGDYDGSRIIKACEVAAAGYVPVILVSGPTDLYGQNEADLAIRYAVSRGCPKELLHPLYSKAFSTKEEAVASQPELRRRGVRKLLIVTSNYHTRRAGGIFRGALRDEVSVHMIAAPDRHFTADSWWVTRQGQKTAFYELSKTLAGWIGL